MQSNDLAKYRYRVDAADVIVWVDSWWLAFARENGALDLNQQSVLGRCLWDFVVGAETQKWYMEIHSQVRKSGKPVVVAFRCDAPSLRRYMRLTISRENQQLLYECILTHAETRVCLNVLDAQQPRSQENVTVCSICSRALLEPAGWLDLEEVSLRLRFAEKRKVPVLQYTVCPTCAGMIEGAAFN